MIEQKTEGQQQIQEKEIYHQIARLQKRVFGQSWPRSLDEAVARYIQYIQVEAVEALQETNFKHHKSIRPINLDALKEEIADLLIYTFALAGVTFSSYEEFMQIVYKKVNKNEVRKDWEINQ